MSMTNAFVLSKLHVICSNFDLSVAGWSHASLVVLASIAWMNLTDVSSHSTKSEGPYIFLK